ncbi:E3 ubiquitin-protein ligase RNF126-like [Macrosteles quadrilineatus]|uniref:E3 ubiquitin-protein ligase RNF126-like n=1 Tax=Macrosteles quadrilineatus TaxID=74068 RepID=UPI0023E22B7C|nr:E3 ubiquitin-protein ligase RNF126-like [Macrosteles quadrilineatus]XP_054279630.1 E3 ubiquitin-protein ligase RNF126-like [Macrosteles quadrilineatus]
MSGSTQNRSSLRTVASRQVVVSVSRGAGARRVTQGPVLRPALRMNAAIRPLTPAQFAEAQAQNQPSAAASAANRTGRIGRPSLRATVGRVLQRNSVATRLATNAARAPVAPVHGIPQRVRTRRSAANEIPPAASIPFVNSTNVSESRISLSQQNYQCPICLLDTKNENLRILATLCGHVFCKECIFEAYKKKNNCPMCQKPLDPSLFREIFI